MAIVVALLGAFNCGTTVALHDGESLAWHIVPGAAFVLCGLVLMFMLRRPARGVYSGAAFVSSDADAFASFDASHLAPLGTAILVAGTLVMFLGVADVWLGWHDPFSWMMATVGLAVFIDALCLRISLGQSRR